MTRSYSTTFVSLGLLLLAPACKKSSSEPSAPPADPKAAEVPSSPVVGKQGNLAIHAPDSTKAMTVGDVVRIESAPDLGAFKQQLADQDLKVTGDEKVAAGVLIRYVTSEGIKVAALHRGGFVCSPASQDTQAAVDAAAAMCAGFSASPAGVVVPVTLQDEELTAEIDGLMLKISKAGEDDATEKAALERYADPKILKRVALAGGFGLAIDASNGGVASQGRMYSALARMKVGSLTVRCEPYAGTKTAADAVRILDTCAALTAP